MSRKARKQLHKQIQERQSRPMQEKDWWDISVCRYRLRDCETLGWGVIVYDVYETYSFCEFYSESENAATQFAAQLTEKLSSGTIRWKNYWNKVSLHYAFQFGCYYSGGDNGSNL